MPIRMLRDAPAASSINLGKNVTSAEGFSVILPCSSSDQLNTVTSYRSGAVPPLRKVMSALVADGERLTSVGVTVKLDAIAE